MEIPQGSKMLTATVSRQRVMNWKRKRDRQPTQTAFTPISRWVRNANMSNALMMAKKD
jgi:hypothetical protein